MSNIVPNPFPTAAPIMPPQGGLKFKDAAPMICGVVDNGVSPDDSRVLIRLNEATKIILDLMIPVGGMATANIAAVDEVILLPPQMENIYELHPLAPGTKVRGDDDITQGWYEIVNNSTYLDPNMYYDNPTVDLGLWPDPTDPSVLRRAFQYEGLQPSNAVMVVTGAKRYLPLSDDEDYLIVQNIEAIKRMILSIERTENNDQQGAAGYMKSATDLLEAEVKKHIMDPRNYMFRKSQYENDVSTFPPNTLGWVRGQIALDLDAAMKTGKKDLTWSINQVERRIMLKAVWKDCIVPVQAEVVGGIVYFPLYVGSVLAVDMNGCPIPIRSQFFEHLDNGPGMFAAHPMLKDLGDEYFPGTMTTRRKYKLIADCANVQCINAICKLRWLEKKPSDLMVIKNYEAIRLFMTAKFLEEKEDWKNAEASKAEAWKTLTDELNDYLRGIRFTPHIQTYGFGLNDVGGGCGWGGVL